MTWFTLSLLSVFALATAELTQQYLLNSKNAFNERASTVFTFLFQSLLTIPVIFVFSLQGKLFSVFNKDVIVQIFTVTVVASVAMVFYLRSFRVKNISFSTIFISGSTIVSTALGIMFLGEEVYISKFVGIFLVLLAIIILNIKNASLERNHYYGLLVGVMFGVAYTLDKSISLKVDPLIYIFWAFFLVALFGFLFNPKDVLSSVRGRTFSDYKPIIFSGFGYFFYNLSTFFAYRFGGEVGKIDAINNSQVFLIILFEFFILKHTKSIVLKLSTAVIAAIGVIILGMH